MKNLILLLLLLPAIAFADVTHIDGTSFDDIDQLEGQTTPVPTPVGTCPSYHNLPGVRASWDGDYDGALSGAGTACDNQGNPLVADTINADLGTYGEGGSYAQRITANDQSMVFTQLGNAHFDFTIAQTMCVKIRLASSPTGVSPYISAETTDGSAYARVYNSTGTTLAGRYDYGPSGTTVTRTGVPTAVWVNVAYAYDPGNLLHWLHNGTTDSQAAIGGAGTDQITTIRQGGWGANNPGVEVLIDEWVVVDGYQVACTYF